jgi:hypothetical protein
MAYNKSGVGFFFQTMGKIGIAIEFITMVQVLFANVKVAINLNGKMTKTFEIKRGFRQGYPLTPHLFLTIRKMLNVMVNQVVKESVIQGIKLL